MMAALCAWQRRASLSLSWSGGEETGTCSQPGWGPTSPELSGPLTHSIMGMWQHPLPSSGWLPLLLTTLPMGQSKGDRKDRQTKHGRVPGSTPGQHLMAQHGCEC